MISTRRPSTEVRRRHLAARACAGGLVTAMAIMSTMVTARSDAAFVGPSQNTTNSFVVDTLAAPTAVSATGGGEIALSWTPTTDTYASGHRVLRATSPGGPYTQVAQVTPRTTSTYIDDPPEGTYYYVVRAFRLNWESVDSNEDDGVVSSVDLVGSWQTGLSHTAAAGSNRVLVFVATNEEQTTSTPTLTGVTYGGQPLVHVVSHQVATSFTALVEIWILDEAGVSAASGTSISPTWSSTPDTPLYSHAVFDDVDQASPTGATATGSATGNTPNPAPVSPVVTSKGDIVIAAANAGEVGSYIPQNGFVVGSNQDRSSGGTTAHGTAYLAADGSDVTVSMLFDPASPPYINRQAVLALVVNVSP